MKTRAGRFPLSIALGVPLLAAPAAFGCALVLGIDDLPAEGDDASAQNDAANDAVTPETCTCLPPLPPGWQGPFVVDELAACASPWNLDAGVVHAGLDAADHVCTCACSSPATACLWQLWNGTCGQVSCGTPEVPIEGVCGTASFGCGQAGIFSIEGGGPCVPDASEQKPAPAWALTARVCSGPVLADACATSGAPCVGALPATGAYCIAHEGASPCPPQYATQRAYYRDFDDTRGCTACTCADAGRACELAFYTEAGCTESARFETQFAPTTCFTTPLNESYKLVRAAAGCAAVGGAQTGGLVASHPVTVCCKP